MKFFDTMKVGVRAMRLAIQGDRLTEERIVRIIHRFDGSNEKKLMEKGDRYYRVDNDIKKKENYRIVDGKRVDESFKANNKIAHAKYKMQVDEKIGYLLSRDFSIQSEDTAYLDKLTGLVSLQLQEELTELGYEASNKGIGWLHVYIDEMGQFKLTTMDALQIIPIWKDEKKRLLDKLIRVFEVEDIDKKKKRKVEVWEADGVTYYVLENGYLVLDYNKSYANSDKISHYIKNGVHTAWGKIPFIPFKNNRLSLPDIKFVETLVDAYDNARSEAANYVEEVKNLIYVLKGYGGENLDQFMNDLNMRRAIAIDDVEDGGVEALTPTMDITATKEHYEQLKRDLAEDGQSINKDLDRFGSAPSGVALKFMYAGLDLKCNLMESQFKRGFQELLYFANEYLNITQKLSPKSCVDIIFNRDMEINEAEVITNCVQSKGMISDETIIANHPWVRDVSKELDAVREQEASLEPKWDKVE